jgi:glutathione S-transferase
MWTAVEKFDQLISFNGTKFLAGDNPTIADFLFYHEMTNLIILGKNH